MSTIVEITEAEIQACIRNALPTHTSLVYVDYRDDFSHSVKKFQPILDGEQDFYTATDELIDDYWLWDSQSSSIKYYTDDYVKPALSKLLDKYGEVDMWLERMEDFIRDLCHDRDDSTPLKDMLRNTGTQEVMAILWSNEEGLRSAYDNSRYGYRYEGYFKTVLDTLQLNPAQVKKALLANNEKVSGTWPNRAKRNPYVDLKNFMVELENTCSQCNHLTFIGLVDLAKLENFTDGAVIPAGNCCGFFDPACGSGSVMEVELLRDFKLDTRIHGDNSYDKFGLHLDDSLHYSMDSVYGPTRKFWGAEIGLS